MNDQNNINNSFDQSNNKANESFDYEANEISRLVKAEYKKIDEEESLSCNKFESNDHNLKNDQNNINNSFDQNNNKANEIVW